MEEIDTVKSYTSNIGYLVQQISLKIEHIQYIHHIVLLKGVGYSSPSKSSTFQCEIISFITSIEGR